MRVPMLVAFALTSAISHSQALRPIPLNEVAGLRIWEDSIVAESSQPGGVVRFGWDVRFKNESPREIARIDVQLVDYVDGRPIFKCKPFSITKFDNSGVPHHDSLLPFSKAMSIPAASFDLPSRLWTTASELRVEITRVYGFRPPVDLHDAGHLFARLFSSREPDDLALFKKDPSLLKVKNDEGVNALLIAFACCPPNVIQYVAAHGGGNYSDTTRGGTTIMHLAAVNGYQGVTDLALKHGGKVDAKAKSGRTPLIKAIMQGMPLGWRWLLAHGADPNYQVPGSWTNVQYAIHEGQTEALKDLIKAGAKPRGHDKLGLGWMDYAVDNYVLLDFVHGLGVPVDERNPRTGATPLMLAAATQRTEAEVWLLKHGANPEAKDKAGRTAYDYSKLGNTLRTDRFFRDLVARYGRR